MPLYENFLRNPNWWAGHLHETAVMGTLDEEEGNILLETVFGTTLEESNRFWSEILRMDEEFGFWPQIHLALPQGHTISVAYFGVPRYDVEYRYGTPAGESLIVAMESGHNILPGWRWPEVKAIAALLPHIAPSVILLLAPSASVSNNEKEIAKKDIQDALNQLSFLSPSVPDLAKAIVESIRLDAEWIFDEKYGWISNKTGARYYPTATHSLTYRPDEFYFALKDFTNFLGLNNLAEQ